MKGERHAYTNENESPHGSIVVYLDFGRGEFTSRIFGARTVVAFDLTKIERHIERQPEYTTDAPGYCLLVFGPEAETRVWLVNDGNVLYVDRNGNDDLTEVDERVIQPETSTSRTFDAGLIRDQLARGYSLRVYMQSDGTAKLRVKQGSGNYQYAGWSKATKPRFANKPEEAPIIHFGGPMTFGQYGPRQSLPRDIEGKSYRKTSLKLMIGTPGIGEGSFASYHCRCRRDKNMTAKVEYPSRSGGGPITTEVAYKMHG
ncbi:MAG TPA: hypothetical protein EYQ75_20750 [Planctomycetaceae bacterium]|nr:hypothetical protein [Planctomycetaceae bacterium]